VLKLNLFKVLKGFHFSSELNPNLQGRATCQMLKMRDKVTEGSSSVCIFLVKFFLPQLDNFHFVESAQVLLTLHFDMG
jgi:hypothetical protein